MFEKARAVLSRNKNPAPRVFDTTISQVKPPFVPNVAGEDDDTSNFDTMFTDETPNFTPVNEGKYHEVASFRTIVYF